MLIFCWYRGRFFITLYIFLYVFTCCWLKQLVLFIIFINLKFIIFKQFFKSIIFQNLICNIPILFTFTTFFSIPLLQLSQIINIYLWLLLPQADSLVCQGFHFIFNLLFFILLIGEWINGWYQFLISFQIHKVTVHLCF